MDDARCEELKAIVRAARQMPHVLAGDLERTCDQCLGGRKSQDPAWMAW